MLKPTQVKALPNYRLWIQYSDGVNGEVDLSSFVGKGVFKSWTDYATFEQVHIGENRQIAWNDEIDLCADSLYMQITGKKAEEVFAKIEAA